MFAASAPAAGDFVGEKAAPMDTDMDMKLSMSLDAIREQRAMAAANANGGKAKKNRRRSGSGREKRSAQRQKPYGKAPRSQKKEVSIYVGNIPWEATKQDMLEAFARYGCTRADVGEKINGRMRGFAILKFPTSKAANRAIMEMHGGTMNGRKVLVREDREDGGVAPMGGRGGGGRTKPAAAGEASVYVGNIPWAATWQDMKDSFARFGCTHADVGEVINGKMRGFAILKFATQKQARRAIMEMNGGTMGDRQIIVREDVKPEKSGNSLAANPPGSKTRPGEVSVFVGNIPWQLSWQELKDAFASYNVNHVDVGESRGGRMRGFAVLKFASRRDANSAIQGMNGQDMGGRAIEVRLDEKA